LPRVSSSHIVVIRLVPGSGSLSHSPMPVSRNRGMCRPVKISQAFFRSMRQTRPPPTQHRSPRQLNREKAPEKNRPGRLWRSPREHLLPFIIPSQPVVRLDGRSLP
jgi:hypothetical protein